MEAGWYQDPKDPTRGRWHDGDGWTDHTVLLADHQDELPPPPLITRTERAALREARKPWWRKPAQAIPAALVLIAMVPGAPVLVGVTFLYGFCLGQITTLSPIIVRREFGAASFGTLYGVAGTVIQLSSAFGPALYGVARDLLGRLSARTRDRRRLRAGRR